MTAKHYLFLLAVFVVGYFVGIKFPGAGSKVIGAVPSVSP